MDCKHWSSVLGDVRDVEFNFGDIRFDDQHVNCKKEQRQNYQKTLRGAARLLSHNRVNDGP